MVPIAAWRVTYTPGDWLVLAGPTTAVVMLPAPSRATAVITELWEDIVQARSLDALLKCVADLGLDRMPDFAAFHWDSDGLHGLTRGLVKVLDDRSGETVLDGRGTVTWREEHLGGERRLRVDLGSGESPDSVQLPLLVGAATVSSLTLSTDSDDLVRFPSAEGTGLLTPLAILDDAGDEGQDADEMDLAEASPAGVDDDAFDHEHDPYDDDHDPYGDEVDLYDDEPMSQPTPFAGFSPIPPPASPDADEPFLAPPFAAGLSPVAVFDEPASLSSPSAEHTLAAPQSDEEDDSDLIFSLGRSAAAPDVPFSSGTPADAPAQPGGVLVVTCLNGHPNEPGARLCRICMGPVDSSRAQRMPRPELAAVHTTQGQFAEVGEGVIIGRAPDPAKGPAGATVLRVTSPSNDISRSHLLVTTSGWSVHVTDLNSTNGTTVLPVSGQPFALREGDSVVVELGTVLDLGDGVSVRIEPPRA